MTPYELIVAYLKAFEALHGTERELPTIRYEKGFFTFSWAGKHGQKYRRKGLEQMLNRLREMATA